MRFKILLLSVALLLGCIGCRAGDPVMKEDPTAITPNAEPTALLQVLTYNTYYVFSEDTEVDAGTDWIAQRAPDVVALQELTDISETRLAELAAGWDHAHSALLKTSGFSVGLTSNSPIQVLEAIRDDMHHGALHARVEGTHFFVVHLSPFRWSVRTAEAEILLSRIQPLLMQGENVVVLGDFNAMSPADRDLMDAQPAVLERARASDEKHAHVENLRNDAFDYSVMQRFLDAGLIDTTLPFLTATGATRWTCPTGIWSEEKTHPPKEGSRIDFILASPELAQSVTASHAPRTGILNQTSDHFPVCTDFEVKAER